MNIHFALLHLGINQDGAVRETGHAPGVFGMEVRRRQIELVAGCESFRHSRDSGAVASPQACVDDQSRGLSHDNPNVRPADDLPDVIRDLQGVFAQRFVSIRISLSVCRSCQDAQQTDGDDGSSCCRSPNMFFPPPLRERRSSPGKSRLNSIVQLVKAG